MYVVYVQVGELAMPLNTWLDYWLAYQEAESLNKRDYKGYYFVAYKEKFSWQRQ